MEAPVFKIADLVRISTIDGHWNTNVPGKARVFAELSFGQFGVPVDVAVTSFVNCSGVSLKHQLSEVLRHRDSGTMSLLEKSPEEISQNAANRLYETIPLTAEVESLFLDFEARFNAAVSADAVCQQIYQKFKSGLVLGYNPELKESAVVNPTEQLLDLQNDSPRLLILRPSHLAHDAPFDMTKEFVIPFGDYVLSEISRNLPDTSIILL